MFRRWLNQLTRQLFPHAHRRGRRRPGPRPTQPRLEPLEIRLVPTLTTLATFTGANGANPYASVIEDSSGNLFGTTQQWRGVQ